ncbi:MAG: nucleoside triphosphate pyrophosphohydrolase [Marinilabiliaceae bacterium]|nr:nucleoside triphosphate pyrophosphohydrolase [Marinilabiliaceae bacterium]
MSFVESYNRFADVLDRLRVECPWDKKQTWETLRTMTIEETYELAEAISQNDVPNVKKELGDVFLHIAFYAKIATEQQLFSFADVLDTLTDKLIYRHPHIFGNVEAETAEEVTRNWEKLKLKEKDGNKSVLSGVPTTLPALIKAYRIQGKAQGVGFDWDEASQVLDKVNEELNELRVEIDAADSDKMEAEMGDLLFAVINLARKLHINPENALERTNKKFIRRFSYLEEHTIKQGRDLKDMSLAEMDLLWNEAKQLERNKENK